MPVLRTTEPLRRELEHDPARPPVPVDLLGRHRAAADERRRPGAARALARRRSRTRCARRASSASAAPTSAARSRSTTSTATLHLLETYRPPPIDRARSCGWRSRRRARDRARCGRRRSRTSELRPQGRRHSPERDRRSVRHHYDVSNDFFALFLDESMTYSCAFFSRDGSSLEAAQRAKLELVCTKLALEKGERVLDVGCGWGSFAIHAAQRPRRVGHGHHAVRAAGRARAQARRRGRRRRTASTSACMDYRELAGEPYDAIASIGMVEHVGANQIDEYAQTLARLLRPGGRLLNHGIARLRRRRARGRAVLRALRVPRRRAAAPVADPGGDRARGPGDPPRRGLPRATTPRRCATGRAGSTTNLDEAEALVGRGAHARLAALPARRAPRLRDRLHVGLPGSLLKATLERARLSSAVGGLPAARQFACLGPASGGSGQQFASRIVRGPFAAGVFMSQQSFADLGVSRAVAGALEAARHPHPLPHPGARHRRRARRPRRARQVPHGLRQDARLRRADRRPDRPRRPPPGGARPRPDA